MDPFPFNAARLGDEFARMRPPQPGTLIARPRHDDRRRGARHSCARSAAGCALHASHGAILARSAVAFSQQARPPSDARQFDGRIAAPLDDGSRHSAMAQHLARFIGHRCARRRRNYCDAERHARFVSRRRRGVILAAGGFEHNQAMRDEYLPKPTRAEWTVTPPSNTGDAIRAGQGVGAQVALMDHAWWAPTVFVIGREKRRALFVERNLPGCVMVNRLGNRFVDEAAPYSEIVYAMYADIRRATPTCPRGSSSMLTSAASIHAAHCCRAWSVPTNLCRPRGPGQFISRATLSMLSPRKSKSTQRACARLSSG